MACFEVTAGVWAARLLHPAVVIRLCALIHATNDALCNCEIRDLAPLIQALDEAVGRGVRVDAEVLQGAAAKVQALLDDRQTIALCHELVQPKSSRGIQSSVKI